MRKLSKKQIRLLENESSPDQISWDEISHTLRLRLIQLNNYETLQSDVDRWLWDKAMNERFK